MTCRDRWEDGRCPCCGSRFEDAWDMCGGECHTDKWVAEGVKMCSYCVHNGHDEDDVLPHLLWLIATGKEDV